MELLWLWIALGVLLVIAVVALLLVLAGRKRIRAQGERADAAWQQVQASVSARDGLLAQLSEQVAELAGHERQVLEDVATARAELAGATGPAAASAAENHVQGAIRRLLQVADGLPQLQRDSGFLHAQAELARHGSEIQTSRRHYNGAVREYNTALKTFPSFLGAATAGARPREFFEVTDRAAIAAPPRVQF